MTQTLEYLVSVVAGEVVDATLDPEARALAGQLLALQRQERQLSELRRRLHDRLASSTTRPTEARQGDHSA